jgi:hypothetical protein
MLAPAVQGGAQVTANMQPTGDASLLARRLRELRERGTVRLTQTELGRALADETGPLSAASISMWEKPDSGRLPPRARLEAYARLFCTPRSFEGEPRMLADGELTAEEQDRFQELLQELVTLREQAGPHPAEDAPGQPLSMWHFPDGSRITLVCSRLPDERRPVSAEPGNLQYVRSSGLADLDTLIDIYGAIRAFNPTSRIVFTAAQELTKRDVTNHMVVIGSQAWEIVSRWFSRIFPIPIDPADPDERGVIVVRPPGGEKREFPYTVIDGQLVEDVGFFARGANPSAPLRTLTVCGGITTRGVHGAALCFIDWEMRDRNHDYLIPRFPDRSTYCIVMKVPVINGDPIAPDLSKEENILFEWSSAETGTE